MILSSLACKCVALEFVMHHGARVQDVTTGTGGGVPRLNEMSNLNSLPHQRSEGHQSLL